MTTRYKNGVKSVRSMVSEEDALSDEDEELDPGSTSARSPRASFGVLSKRAKSRKTLSVPSNIETLDLETLDSLRIPDGRRKVKKITDATTITIPSAVQTIGEGAFSKCKYLTTVEFESESTLTTIGPSAFKGCAQFQTIVIPSSVTSIQESAFEGCTALKTVTFEPNSSLEEIGVSAFEGCDRLQSITIPCSVVKIGVSSFAQCRRIANLTFEEGDMGPSRLTTIGSHAFRKCERFQELKVPPAVKTMGESAFEGCKQLQTITIPRSVESMGHACFARCRRVTSVTFEGGSRSSLRTIGPHAFKKCEQLPEITIPPSVVTVGDSSFDGCRALTSVTFQKESSVTTIGRGAFHGCKQIETITIPPSVATIEGYAFVGCGSLTTIKFEDGYSIKKIGESAFYKCENLHEIEVPKSVERDGEVAFFGSMEIVGEYAFYGCKNLLIDFPDSTSFGGNAFGQCSPEFLEDLLRSHDRTSEIFAAAMESYGGIGKFLKFLREFDEVDERQAESKLLELTIKSVRLQQALNRKISERKPAFVFFLMAYLNIALATAFVVLARGYLGGWDGWDEIEIEIVSYFLYGLLALDFLLELCQMRLRGFLGYVGDFWNWFDSTKIGLVALSTTIILISDRDTTPGDFHRYLLMVTGAVVITAVVVFLRSTFLPFAEFVGGMINIMITLIPFLVVSFLIICAFAFMYYALAQAYCPGEPDEDEPDFCKMDAALHTTLEFFFNGPEQTRWWALDLVVGLIIVVVLLNVVIAIVSNEWSDSKKRAGETFWAYRINFLFDVRSLPFAYEDRQMWSLLDKLDDLGEYCSSGSEIWNWRDEWDYADDFCSSIYFGLKIALNFVIYVVLLLFVGPVSFGLLWPRRVREYVFSHDYSEDETTMMLKGVESIQRTLAAPKGGTVETRLAKIEQQQKETQEKLDRILGLLSAQLHTG